jgi:hypothetical protein
VFVASAVLFLPGSAHPQSKPSEIPKNLVALAADQNFSTQKRVWVEATSRRQANPATPEYLVKLRQRAIKSLLKTPLSLAPDKSTAELELELIFEPNVRYGMFHYQNAPYIYLTLREAEHGRLVYCSYHRLERIRNVSNILFEKFERLTRQQEPAPEGSLQDCAEQAMRPMYYSSPAS